MIPRVRPRRDRLKHCSGPCGQWLPVVECFNKDSSRIDGYRSVCRACKAERESELAAGAPRRRPWSSKRTIAAMSAEAGLSPSTLGGRLLAGWKLEDALSKPVAPSGRNNVRVEEPKGARKVHAMSQVVAGLFRTPCGVYLDDHVTSHLREVTCKRCKKACGLP